MTKRIKIHDGIIGALVLASAVLAWQVDVRLVALAGLTALIMISSSFTGFCPVHFTLKKLVRED